MEHRPKMKPRFSTPPRLLAALPALVALAVIALGGLASCAGEDPDIAGANGLAGNNSGETGSTELCADGMPHPGSACRPSQEGERTACGKVTSTLGDQIVCGNGDMVCENGFWGECILNNTIRLHPGGDSLTLGSAQTCDSNPCDIYCGTFIDTPDGLSDPDNGIIADGNGITLPGVSGGGSGGSGPCTGGPKQACAHSICETGGPLEPNCDSMVKIADPPGKLKVTYQDDYWGSGKKHGYTRKVTVENVSSDLVTWTVYLKVPGDMYEIWSAKKGSTANGKTAFTGETWNAELDKGEKAEFGWNAWVPEDEEEEEDLVEKVLWQDDFSSNNGWDAGGNSSNLGQEWQIGPTFPNSWGDPEMDTSPSDDNGVLGVILGGLPKNETHGWYVAESPSIDLSNAQPPIRLRFKSWLNTHGPAYMLNAVSVYSKYKYTDKWKQHKKWIELWRNNDAIKSDKWKDVVFDITGSANKGGNSPICNIKQNDYKAWLNGERLTTPTPTTATTIHVPPRSKSNSCSRCQKRRRPRRRWPFTGPMGRPRMTRP